MKEREKRDLFDLIIESTHDAIVAVDKGGYVFVFNPSAEKLVGKNAKDVLGKHIREVIPNTRLDYVIATGKSELNQRQDLGSTIIITNRVPIRDESGNVVGAVAVFRDITEVKHLAEEITNLKQVQTLLSAIINSTQDAISVVDANGNGLLINPAYTRLTGLSEKDVLGRPATVDIAEGESMHMKVLRTRQPVKNVPMKVGPMRRQVVVDVAPVIVDDQLKGSVGVIHDVSEIIRLTEELEKIRKYVRQLEAKYTFNDIVAISPLMLQAVEQAKRVAATSATVLLRGESGTGKELFAHAIHSASPRARRAFVRVNCAALPESLLESELFGYVEGAFTGAKRGGRRGLFQEADGGTLFLDEVGVMGLSLQASLLRALQEKEITMVGDSKPTVVDVRVLAATNVSLEQLVAEGKFREDLYYRLNVIPIFIPPLRQRIEDLPELCQHLVRRLNQEYGRSVQGIDPEVIRVLQDYKWPGNVRELENALGRAIINMKYNEDIIKLQHLPVLGETKKDVPQNEPGKSLEWDPTFCDLKTFLEREEKRAIEAALRYAEGSKTRAARILGISIRSLYYKMERHGLAGKVDGRTT